ncbi:hypothetical protein QYM36_018134 [Artemia franciscana]|uniref:Endonuclease/exonuclease/phosphatase domain-containing protein n=1 Tax=Artemia franciscana TaxID=6661 RepID=A0AA88KUY0_ARTSF|nr:hypothetical protein QYM36_018134 [Artemia franciscana]
MLEQLIKKQPGKLNSDMRTLDKKKAGVGMALSSRAKKCLVDWEPIYERILRARFATSQAKLTVIVVYAPTNDTVDQTKDDFYRVLSNVVAKAHRHDIVTLCGDFNAKVGSDASYAPAILGRHGQGEINDNGVLPSEFVQYVPPVVIVIQIEQEVKMAVGWAKAELVEELGVTVVVWVQQ